MPAIPVEVPGFSYEAHVERGLLDRVGELLRDVTPSRKAAIISDVNVAPLYAHKVTASLKQAGFEPMQAFVGAGEQHKSLGTLASIYDQLLEAKIERTTPVLALGGGVIGDIAGFAAATMLRGMPFVQVPTTLLAMVDASIGGKTGVNHAVGKNLIGAFHQPKVVFIDPDTLQTLPEAELRSGLAECIKHDVIRDADGFARLEAHIKQDVGRDLDYLAELVAHNVAIKAAVVSNDPYEKGERAHLNFGHTFGHAIEKVCAYSFSHGQCVAFGMVAACKAAHAMRIVDAHLVTRVMSVIHKAGLMTAGTRLDTDEVVAAMAFDKKVSAGAVRFILPTKIGEVVIRDDVPSVIVRAAVESIRLPNGNGA